MNAVGFSLTLDDRRDSLSRTEAVGTCPFRPDTHPRRRTTRVFYPWIENGFKAVSTCERYEIRAGLESSRANRSLDTSRNEASGTSPGPSEASSSFATRDGRMDALVPESCRSFRNGWAGYELVVETTSVERLD